jgi:hypothetical protein
MGKLFCIEEKWIRKRAAAKAAAAAEAAARP